MGCEFWVEGVEGVEEVEGVEGVEDAKKIPAQKNRDHQI